MRPLNNEAKKQNKVKKMKSYYFFTTTSAKFIERWKLKKLNQLNYMTPVATNETFPQKRFK